jgi:hypothetical protein
VKEVLVEVHGGHSGGNLGVKKTRGTTWFKQETILKIGAIVATRAQTDEASEPRFEA